MTQGTLGCFQLQPTRVCPSTRNKPKCVRALPSTFRGSPWCRRRAWSGERPGRTWWSARRTNATLGEGEGQVVSAPCTLHCIALEIEVTYNRKAEENWGAAWGEERGERWGVGWGEGQGEGLGEGRGEGWEVVWGAGWGVSSGVRGGVRPYSGLRFLRLPRWPGTRKSSSCRLCGRFAWWVCWSGSTPQRPGRPAEARAGASHTDHCTTSPTLPSPGVHRHTRAGHKHKATADATFTRKVR